MDIRFSGKNISVTEGMREHLREKLVRLEKYAPRIVESHVILKKEKYLYVAEITLLAKNFRSYGDGVSKENIFTAMDQAYLRIEKQLKRFREKIKDHHKHGLSRVTSGLELDQAAAGKPAKASAKGPRVVRTDSFEAKPMSVEEASLQLKLSESPFLVYRNAADRKVNVIFKRGDGNHGLIEPDI